MTRPYGWKRGLWRGEDCGPPSTYTGSGYKGRHRDRQLLHKTGRHQGRREIESQLAEMDEEDYFFCSGCGDLTPESERSTGTTECGYC